MVQQSSVGAGMPRMLQYLLIDTALLALYVLALDVPLTGLALHEWFGVAIAGLLVVHLLQHPKWIAVTTSRFWSRASLKAQLNFVVMIGLFVSFTVLITSGLVISEVAVPWVGLKLTGSDFWLWLHLAAVDWVAWIVGLHIALNWQWVVGAVKRFAVAPIVRRWKADPEPVAAETKGTQ